MTDNPYESPQPVGVEDWKRVRDVARYHRLVIYALVANMAFSVAAVLRVLYGRPSYAVSVVLVAAMIGIVVFSMAAMFLLMNALQKPVRGVVCGVFAISPCIAVFIQLVINQYATNYLTDRGVKIGLLGANLRQFRRRKDGSWCLLPNSSAPAPNLPKD